MIKRFRGQGIDIEGDVLGDRHDTPVIFQHGGGQTRHAWGEALARVAESNFFGISLDLRGHGGSQWPADGNYRIDAFIEDLVSVVNTLDTSPFLVGASLGGLACLVAAGEKHVTARGLILVDVTPRIETEGAQKIRAFMEANAEGFADIEEVADAVAAYQPHRPRPRNASGLRKNLREGSDGRLYWHWDPRMLRGSSDLKGINHERLSSAASKLDVPSLIIRGSLSEVVSKEGVAEFQALAPHAEYVDVAGADHMVAGDKNDVFNDAVIDFLSRHRSRAR